MAIPQRILFFIGFLLTMVGCSKNEVPEPTPTPNTSSKRVIMAYMVANNNLDEYIMNNVEWMYQGLSEVKDTCTLLIYYKGKSSNAYIKKPEILKYQTDGRGKINGEPILTGSNLTKSSILSQAEVYDAVSGIATDPIVMKANLEKMRTIAPSMSYGLIFASHATSWMPATKTVSTRSFGVDGSYEINLPEMASAIQNSFPAKNVDFILFDACMMGTAEVCYELKDATHYCIASVMESPADGFPYHKFFSKLYDKEINYQYVCDETINFNKSENTWGTYAVVDCSQMEQLAAATKAQLMENADLLAEFDYESVQQYGAVTNYNDFLYFSFDMGDFIKQLNGGTIPADYQTALDKAIVYKTCLERAYYNVVPDKDIFSGIGMYFPGRSIQYKWDSYYPSVKWYNAAGWSELMK